MKKKNKEVLERVFNQISVLITGCIGLALCLLSGRWEFVLKTDSFWLFLGGGLLSIIAFMNYGRLLDEEVEK